MPTRKEATFLLNTDTLFKSVRNKLLESGKEPVVVVALWIIRPDPGPVAELVGIEGGVVSGVFNLKSSGVEAPDRRPRHEEHYHEA